MSLVVLAAYVLGASLGFWASRRPSLERSWPRYVRGQLLAASIVLSVSAAWRLTGIQDVVWPLAVVAVCGLLLVLALALTRGERAAGRAVLWAWTGTPNTGFFVVPFSAAFAGPTALLVGVLADRLGAPLWAVYVHLLRRDAPIPQRRRSSWIDQSPVLALVVGLALHLVGPAPDWTAAVSLAMAPVLAATGAAVFVGSVLHPTQRIDPRPGLGRWAAFVALRIALLVPVILLAPDGVRLALILCALSIPAFGPAQFSTVYGYAEPVVAAAARYGWWIGGLGIVVGYAITH
jgi:FtsH-binding integral membrane protein